MASPLALRRALASAVSSSKLARPVRSASAAPFLTPARSFNTDAQMTRVDGDGSKAVDVDRTAPDRSVSRRRDRSVAPFSGAKLTLFSLAGFRFVSVNFVVGFDRFYFLCC